MSDIASEREIRALRQRVAELQKRLAFYSVGVSSEVAPEVSISEREELLVEAERVAHMGSWIWNIESGVVHWSDELYRVLGYDPATDTASTEAFFRAVHPEDVERVRAVSARGVATGVTEQVDYRVLRKDGSVRRVTMSGAQLFDSAGVLKRIVGTVLDVTDEHLAEEAMARAHAELEEAQAIAAVGSWTVCAQTQALSWSTELRRIIGATADETPTIDAFLGRIHPDDRGHLQAVYAAALGTGQVGDVEARVMRADSVRTVRMKGVPLVDDHGQVTLIRGTLQDVTEQRSLQEQLAQAQRMESVGRLAGGVAHDLNNHLMVIEGNLEVLALPRSPELDALRGAISAASETTSRLLAFGRSSPLKKRPVEPNRLVVQALLLLERVIPADIALSSTLGADLPHIDVDEGMIGQCLVNLVLNARDAVSTGGTIEVLTRRPLEEPNILEISVRDDGTGMDDATRSRVFEPFFTTKSHGKGSGLGLAMVQGTVEQHGGTVVLVSEPGKGATFTMRLPLAEVAVASERGPSVSRVSGVAPSTILVVDDQAPVAAVLKRLLEADGHRVLVAERPRAALEAVHSLGAEIDLILSDVVMPEMRGPALIQEIIRQTGRNYPVIFMSGYSHDDLSPDELVRLRKPFLRADLQRALAEVLGEARKRAT